MKFFYSSERNSSGLCMVAGTQRHQRNELTEVLSGSINLQEYPLSLIDQGQRRLSFRDSITTPALVLVIPFQKLLLDLSLLFFCLDIYEKKKDKSRIAGQQLTTRAWQTLPCFFFFWGIVTLARASKMHFYFVELFSVRAPQNQWRCVW